MHALTPFLMALVRFGVTPVFLGMAYITHDLNAGGAGHGTASLHKAIHGSAIAQALGHEAASTLSSMWLMWLMMAVAHALPWLQLLAGRNQDRESQ